MSLTDQQVREALDTCAAEPVHIPGTVQPFACLLAADRNTHEIVHASENCAEFIGMHPETAFGQTLRQVLGREAAHELNNMLARDDTDQVAELLGDFIIADNLQTLHAFTSAGFIVVEIETAQPNTFAAAEQLKALSFLMGQIENCDTEQALFDVTTRALRHITGFDRVKVYRFDHEFNGEVVSEDRRASMPSYLGLHFPHWDIPAQARDIMRQLPVRCITDTMQTPVPLLAQNASAPPLNILLANARGVSAVHMEYLNNMGVQATMTLSIVIENTLWGLISFHHETPRVPAPNIRAFLTSFQQIFATKLRALRQQRRLDFVVNVNALSEQVLDMIAEPEVFQSFAHMAMQIIKADGFMLADEEKSWVLGQVPDEPFRSMLRDLIDQDKNAQMIENMGMVFPDHTQDFNGCAGVIIVPQDRDQTLLFFRKERMRDVTWAGNPEKTIEPHDGKNRLHPRGSFSTYLQQVRGYCLPWSDQDKYFAERILLMVNTVRRRDLATSLARQQQIMIDELNHRVRNILALVRSVSQQARKSYGSLESYSKTLEARINALAASHDLASGSMRTAVPIRDLILKEFEPYTADQQTRLTLTGGGEALLADIAPIFSLVIHELLTNAVKYGALSNDTGKISIVLDGEPDGLTLTWRETGGPPVTQPAEFGFGSTLIQQAVPHELNGDARLMFNTGGVEAHLRLPADVFETDGNNISGIPKGIWPVANEAAEPGDLSRISCLVLEDNFVIGEGMRQQLEDFGIGSVEVVSNIDAARAHLAAEEPSFCILDVNLGRGQTSMDLAHELRNSGKPFFFVSGYGDTGQLDEGLKDIQSLTKPTTSDELLEAIMSTIKRAA